MGFVESPGEIEGTIELSGQLGLVCHGGLTVTGMPRHVIPRAAKKTMDDCAAT
jgi:hypothetical protein